MFRLRVFDVVDERGDAMRKILNVLPAPPQRQDSVADQLADLRVIANRLGLYDAADAIQRLFDADRK